MWPSLHTHTQWPIHAQHHLPPRAMRGTQKRVNNWDGSANNFTRNDDIAFEKRTRRVSRGAFLGENVDTATFVCTPPFFSSQLRHGAKCFLNQPGNHCWHRDHRRSCESVRWATPRKQSKTIRAYKCCVNMAVNSGQHIFFCCCVTVDVNL